MPTITEKKRCPWCTDDPLYIDYHDHEWGIPLHDDIKLFEMLNLEGQQAGLNWLTILKKRDAYRYAFSGFDPERIIKFDNRIINRLMDDKSIIRNRLKIQAIITNAQAFLNFKQNHGDFSAFIWQYTDNQPLKNHWQQLTDVPAFTEQSEKMAKDLKKLGFSFVGKTICYAFMQAVGMVDDHTTDCFRY